MIKKLGCCTKKSDNFWTANIQQILGVKLLANWEAVSKILHYVLDMLNICKQLVNN